ncbi:hypothetical protein [Rhodobacter viridis]|uniref:hypothetical protein n=1 Tax=Rhodobacter viridis TaxID=1054202 RepID=UPI0011B3D1A7|nr:hypothetical protein [Rhodobacter viridis]
MICTVPDHRRTRRWLEARLWSDRGATQASGSLRQSLYEVRQALGPHAGLLGSDRDMVWLSGVVTDLETDPAGVADAIASGREFLEGIDIRDDAFEDWLSAERARLGTRGRMVRHPEAAGPRRVPLLVQVSGIGEGPVAFLPIALASEISRLIDDLAEVEIHHLGPGSAAIEAPERGLRLTIEAAQFDGTLHLVATITNIAQRRVAWTRRARFPGHPAAAIESGDFARLAYEAAEAAHAALSLAVAPDSEIWAQVRQAQAVRAIFTFEREQLLRADRLLRESIDVMPTAQAWAWRAFLCQTLTLERVRHDFAAARDEAESHTFHALSFPGRNATVLAMVSQISAMLAMDAAAAFASAHEAVQINPLNPYAQYALAAAYLRAGDLKAAAGHGRTAADISENAANGFFFQGISALIALAAGDYEECMRIYSAISVRAPHFRAPLRALTVLSLAKGDLARAERHAAALARAEPCFTLESLLHDENYPAVTLRKMGLLHLADQRR